MLRIGKTIRRIRTERDISQRDLAEAAELTPSFLSLLENDHREPSLAALRRIAEALDVPAEVMIWDAVDLPSQLDGEDRRICELAKLLVRRFFEGGNGVSLEDKASRVAVR